MKQLQPVSIVVPTLNEAENISLLLRRIDTSMQEVGAPYEVIIVDDYSSDSTSFIASSLADTYPVRVHMKKGKRGKAYSLLEGFELARYPLTAMIDADLQYAPEELVPMYDLLVANNADVVITDRKERTSSFIRKLMTKTYNFIFARILFGIRFDTQSGLKLFKSDVLNDVTMDPSPWTFDLEFLVRALENKRKIISHTIEFGERNAGVTKVKVVSSSIECAKASLKLRWRTSHRKTREGYRANDRFLKRTFGTAMVIAFLLHGLVVTAKPVDALSLRDIPGVSSIQDLLTGTDTPAESNQNNAQPTQSNTAVATAQQSTATAQANPTQSAVAATGATLSPAATTRNTANGPQSQVAAPANSNQTGALGPATAADTGVAKIYDSGYPNYKLSSHIANKWTGVAAITLYIGIAFLAVAATMYIRKSIKTHTYFKNLRS